MAQQLLLAGQVGLRRGAGQCLDAAHARCDRAFADDLEQTDVAGAADMGATAELDRIGARFAIAGAHRDDAHLLAVFLAEQRERAFRNRLVGAQQPGAHAGIGADLGVDLGFDRDDVLWGQRPRMAEIETEPVGRDQRALLRHTLAEPMAQRLMQQMRHRMVGAQPAAPLAIDAQLDGIADPQRAVPDAADMDKQIAGLAQRVFDGEFTAAGGKDRAGIANLSARLAVKRGLVDDDADLVAMLRFEDPLLALDERQDDALGGLRLVAEEFGRADLLAQREPGRLGRFFPRTDPGGARERAGLFHFLIESIDIDRDAARPQNVLRQVERKAIRIVKRERNAPVQDFVVLQSLAFGHFLQECQPAAQGLPEPLLLETQRLGDQRLGPQQLGEGRAHLLHQGRHQPPHQRLLAAEHMSVAHRPPHDAAQHIAAPFLARQYAVGDQEGRSAQMVGDDPVRHRMRAVRGNPGCLGRRRYQRPEQIDIVIVVLALQHRGDALEPHARVDRRPRQRHALGAGMLLELHEDEVPDFDEAVAVLVGAAGRPAGDPLAVIVEDLRARAARAGVAHRPEIVRGRDANDLVLGEAGDRRP